MKFIGLIKYSNSHSLSPIMFKKVFESLKMEYSHAVLNVGLNELSTTINFIKKDFMIGANVTIPHKENVIKYLDSISDEAKESGAVNTILNSNGKLIGFNTDIFGISEALKKYKNNFNNKDVLLIGAGGAARAAIVSLYKNFEINKLYIYNRTIERALKLKSDFNNKLNIEILKSIPENIFSLIINSTSIGMNPEINQMPIGNDFTFLKNQIIFDIIYNPVETKFLRKAKLDGADTINGIDMFINQAKKSFEIWFEEKFPSEIALDEAMKSLNQK